jgi:hypothetical protein
MVTPSRSRWSGAANRPKRRRRGRAQERGAALFVIVLVVAMVTTVGVFAAGSASVATQTSGHMRQYSQTHYVTEYAMLGAMAELSTNRREAYIKTMTQPKMVNGDRTQCEDKPDLTKVTNATCYRFGYEDLEIAFVNQSATAKFMNEGDIETPGGLGHGKLVSDFVMEMTDLAPASPPVAGSDLTSAGAANVQYMAVTLTATGMIFPAPADSDDKYVFDAARARAASIESARARLIVGPLPNPL